MSASSRKKREVSSGSGTAQETAPLPCCCGGKSEYTEEDAPEKAQPATVTQEKIGGECTVLPPNL
ncbi:hypothetical protein [Rothia aeria]|uniref:hypothetical protein n=1 Tax=Rothia aeria TaxID=172042 RepID=UPI00244CF828|nr:hypothetical protein [Rothia aeria]